MSVQPWRSAGVYSVSVPWLAVVAAGLLLPGAAGAPGVTPSAGAQGVTLHAWVDISNHSKMTPPARQAYAMAYDPLLGVAILFGGNSPWGSSLGDTWEFVGGHWKPVNLNASNGTTGPPAPSARWSAGMVYDPFLSGILLFGGQTSYLAFCGSACALNDTWEYNATGWHDLNLTVAPPAGPAAQLVFDSHDGYDLLVGHPFNNPSYTFEWRFSGGHWTNATSGLVFTPPSTGFFYADDPTDGYVLMFGDDHGCSGLGLTWMYRNGSFHNLTAKQTAAPAAKMGSHAMTYDPRVHGVVMTGGYDASCTVSNQTWLFHRGHWQNVSNITGTSIPGRWDARMVWDQRVGAHGGDITFSGNEATVGGYNSFGSDTWRLMP